MNIIITLDNQRLECDDEHSHHQVMYYKGCGIEFAVSFFPRDPTKEYIDAAAVSYDGARYVYDTDTHRDELRTTFWANSWLRVYAEREGAQLGEIPEYCKPMILEFIEFFLRAVPDDPRSDMSVGMREALSRARASFIERYAL